MVVLVLKMVFFPPFVSIKDQQEKLETEGFRMIYSFQIAKMTMQSYGL